MKKKVILSSILTIALCLSLIAGSTFALFTSESSVDIAVTSGTVRVVASIAGLHLETPKAISQSGVITDGTNIANNASTPKTFGNGGTAEITDNLLTLSNMVPGDKATVTIKIQNQSNVSVKYRTILQSVGEDDSLLPTLKVTFAEAGSTSSSESSSASASGSDIATASLTEPTTFSGENSIAFQSDWAVYEGGDKTITVTIELPATAGNDQQDKTCELAFKVEAVQGNAETVDYGIRWTGSAAPLTRTDSTPANVKTLADVTDTEAKTVKIDTPELLAAFAQSVNAGNNYLNYTVTLEADMDLANQEWTPIGKTIVGADGKAINGLTTDGSASQFSGTFDGKNHTISNLKISSGTHVGLFGHITMVGVNGPNGNYTPGIKNLTIHNVTITADGSGAFVGNANTTTQNAGNGGRLQLHDLKLTGNVKIEGKDVGGIIGTEWTDFQIHASNITVNANEGSYVKGTGTIGGVFASAPHAHLNYIKSNINVIASGAEATAGGIVGCAGWDVGCDSDDNAGAGSIVCTGNVVATGVAATADGKYSIGKIVGAEANNPYWAYYNNPIYGSFFKNFTANNTISITLTDGTVLTSNGMTAADRHGDANAVDYTQSLVGRAQWEWELH